MRESAIEKQVCAYAKAIGWLVMPKASSGNRGWPDRLFIRPVGTPLFIEFKGPGGVLSEAQKVKINQLRKLGYDCQVVRSVEEGFELFDSYRTSPI